MNWQLAISGLAISLTVLAIAYRKSAGTTLRAPIAWSMIVVSSLFALEFVTVDDSGSFGQVLRFLAAVGTLAPGMALLGAKRPQDRGWQFIVASLWLVMAIPTVQPLFFARSATLELHGAWSGFLLILMVVGAANHLPTRYGLPALVFFAAQALLLNAHLPLIHDLPHEWAWRCGLALIPGSLVLAWFLATRPRRRTGWALAWCDFRDTFGAVWALRVMERINQATDEPEISWDGFKTPPEAAISEQLETAIRTSLRRFVSPTWIDHRVNREEKQ